MIRPGEVKQRRFATRTFTFAIRSIAAGDFTAEDIRIWR